MLSCELLVAATLDPSGNIRRGASAALQELIGRHPDTVSQGIPLVQIVDYQAVSLRSRAILEVAVDAARLDQLYEQSIIIGLLGWRGVGSPDAPSRRYVASAMGLIATSGSQDKMETIIAKVCQNLRTNRSRQVEARHGLLYSLAMIIGEAGAQSRGHRYSSLPIEFNVSNHWSIFRSVCVLSYDDLKASALRSDITAEAACTLISALSLRTYSMNSLPGHRSYLPLAADLDSCINVLNWSLSLTGENVVKASSSAADSLFNILNTNKQEYLVQIWATPLKKVKPNSGIGPGLVAGYLAALGAVAHHVSAAIVMQTILESVLYQINASTLMESRVAAVKSLSTVLLTCKSKTFALPF